MDNVQSVSSSNNVNQCSPLVSPDLEFDVCITGTSITECIIAANLALLGLKVLHLESFPFYGKHSGSLSVLDFLEFLHALPCKRNEKKNVEENAETIFCNAYYQWNPFNASRINETDDKCTQDEIKKKRFIIDIHPRILFSNDSFTWAIINSGANQYTEFCNVNTENVIVNDCMWEKNPTESSMENDFARPFCFEPTLQSKSAIFQNKNLSLVEKRVAMKFVTCYLLPCIKNLIEEGADTKIQQVTYNRYNGLTKQFLCPSVAFHNKDETLFIQDTTLWKTVMGQLNIPPSVQIRLTYGFGLKSSQAMVDNENVNTAWTFRTACERFKRIALSVGRYSESPYLYPLYGSGDISQAFCRICAVHKGVYMLNTYIVDFLEKPFHCRNQPNKEKKHGQNVFCLLKSEQVASKKNNQLTLSDLQPNTELYKTLLLSNSLHVNVKRIITSSNLFQLKKMPKLNESSDTPMILKTLKLFKKNENMLQYIRCVAILSSNVLPETSSQYGANFCVFISKTSSPVHLLELDHASGCTDSNYVLLHMTQRLNSDEHTPQETSLDSQCPSVYSKLQTLLKHLLANKKSCQCFFVAMWTEKNEFCVNPSNSDDPDIIYVPEATQVNTSLYLQEANIAAQIVEKVWKSFHIENPLNLKSENIHTENSLRNNKEMLKKNLLERVEQFVVNVSNIQNSNT